MSTYDRVLRAELFHSDRWLDLHSDTARLTFICLVPLADDFGNFEGGRRLWRWLRDRTALKTEQDVTKVMLELFDADMVFRYELQGTEYWHIRRFRSDRRYVIRRVPACSEDDKSLEARRDNIISRRKRAILDLKGQSEEVPAELQQHSGNVPETFPKGIGVGIGVGEKINTFSLPSDSPAPQQKASRLPKAWKLPDDWLQWAAGFSNDQRKPLSPAELSIVADSFRDHWTSKPGKDGLRLDWQATWRNWIRTHLSRLRSSAPSQPPQDFRDT